LRDGFFKTTTSNPYYNATNLAADTTYEIGTRTVDTNENVNTTWVNQTAKTSVPVTNGAVTGTITSNSDETGIAGVNVNLTNQTGTVIASTTTDSSGNYTITALSPGEYTYPDRIKNQSDSVNNIA
jgi:hypothetical protein